MYVDLNPKRLKIFVLYGKYVLFRMLTSLFSTLVFEFRYVLFDLFFSFRLKKCTHLVFWSDGGV